MQTYINQRFIIKKNEFWKTYNKRTETMRSKRLKNLSLKHNTFYRRSLLPTCSQELTIYIECYVLLLISNKNYCLTQIVYVQ